MGHEPHAFALTEGGDGDGDEGGGGEGVEMGEVG